MDQGASSPQGHRLSVGGLEAGPTSS
jgi:transposase